jgi:hypothetical protein
MSQLEKREVSVSRLLDLLLLDQLQAGVDRELRAVSYPSDVLVYRPSPPVSLPSVELLPYRPAK